MAIPPEISSELKYKDAAVGALSAPLLQLPILLSERALQHDPTSVAAAARALAIDDRPTPTEVIGMPKRAYGVRPITVTSPAMRVLYEALVNYLEPALSPESRSAPFTNHIEFGIDKSRWQPQRFVDVDIAACYEYISHSILADELVLQGASPQAAEALKDTLHRFYPQGLGLPQAMPASHRLADTYLAKMQRGIQRSGRAVHRYADDFRIVSVDWADAHAMIELAATEARRIGLTLSDGKARIRSAAQILKNQQEAETLFESHKARASESLRSLQFIQVGYDDFEIEEVDADEVAVDTEALRSIVEDWIGHDREQVTIHPRLATRALKLLASADDRLADGLFVEILEREPLRLPAVAEYILERDDEPAQNWTTLRKIVGIERFGPWSQLWALSTISALPSTSTDGEMELLDWCRTRLSAPHETIRAEAAWILARHARVQVDELAQHFVSATEVSQTAIAAAAGRLEGKNRTAVGRAMRDHSKLTQVAYDWGVTQA